MSNYGIIIGGVLLGLAIGAAALRTTLVMGLVSSGSKVVGKTMAVKKSRIPGFGYVQIQYTNRGRPYSVMSILTRLKKPWSRPGALSPWYVSRVKPGRGLPRYVAVKYDK